MYPVNILYSVCTSIFSHLSPRSQLNNALNNASQPQQAVNHTDMLYNGFNPTALGEFSPEMYAHYMYMYNYMYMQQQLSWTGSVYPVDAYGLLAQSTARRSNSSKGQNTNHSESQVTVDSRTAEVDNVKALKVQEKRKVAKPVLSPKGEQRYQPYARPVITKAKDPISSSGSNANNRTWTSVSGSSKSNSTDNLNSMVCPKKSAASNTKSSSESPLDLSRKTEKLQYLDTLRQLIESSDKRPISLAKVKSEKTDSRIDSKSSATFSSDGHVDISAIKRDSCADNVKIAAMHHDDRSQSPNLNKTDLSASETKSLESKKDKLEFLSVLKELFEKGHSKTSRNILGEEEASCSSSTSTETMNGQSVKAANNSKVVLGETEESLDDLSVDQSFVIRKRQKLD